MKTYIDNTLFLGMHHQNDALRIACKNFFIKNFDNTLYLTLEEVGLCDDIIWSYSREEQDTYYPFMDRLHTEANITRIPYSHEALKKYNVDSQLSPRHTMLLGEVAAQGGTLLTIDPLLADTNNSQTLTPTGQQELPFSEELEKAYQFSLQLRIT